jgi:hypothetical protein
MSYLCELCKSVLCSTAEEGSDIAHHTTIAALIHSASDCHLCYLAWDAFSTFSTFSDWKARQALSLEQPSLKNPLEPDGRVPSQLPNKFRENGWSTGVEIPLLTKDRFKFKFRKHMEEEINTLYLQFLGESEAESMDEEKFSVNFFAVPSEGGKICHIREKRN